MQSSAKLTSCFLRSESWLETTKLPVLDPISGLPYQIKNLRFDQFSWAIGWKWSEEAEENLGRKYGYDLIWGQIKNLIGRR